MKKFQGSEEHLHHRASGLHHKSERLQRTLLTATETNSSQEEPKGCWLYGHHL